MKNSLYIRLLIWAIALTLSCQGVFWVDANSDDSIKAAEIVPAKTIEKKQTIREIQDSINTLQKEKNHLDFKWDTYRIWNETLWDLIRSELTEEERDILEEIIIEYKDSQDEFEGKLTRALESKEETERIKLEFLSEKRAFYMSLIKYIQINKLEQYKNYVDSDLNYNEKSNEVATQIEKRNIEKEERIEEIQGHIDNNKNILRDRIREKVILRVTQKLDTVTWEEKFKQLSNGWKSYCFSKTTNEGSIKNWRIRK